VNLAVTIAIRNAEKNGEELPYLFKKYVEIGMYHPEKADAVNAEYCGRFSETNLLPPEFREILIKEMERLL
jgi:hypothetical protein